MKTTNTEAVTAFNILPYDLIVRELQGTLAGADFLAELTEILHYYKIYKNGSDFFPDDTKGGNNPSQLRYKLASSLINKQARFLFAEAPDMIVEPKGDVGKVTQSAKDSLTVLNDLVKTVFTENKFESQLVKAAKDCFIGKRVAGMVNFNEEDGITITFIPSTHFLFETQTGNDNILTRFVCFMLLQESTKLSERRILRKRFTLEYDVVYVEETIHDGTGETIEVLTEKQKTLLRVIPVNIFLNDGLTGDTRGESEIALLDDFESWYSKLANADKDAERKSMNCIRYTIDMSESSTKKLLAAGAGAGAFWDLGSDQNLEKPNPQVGLLENSMNYSTALQTTLERVKGTAFEIIDMPMVSLDSMQGAITTGKALKAVYWPLIVRCKEKMKTWGPGLRNLVSIIIDGALLYPNTAKHYVSDPLIPVEYEVRIDQNHPLPEDELEEKQMDMAEVSGKTMSRKAYMKKWRGLTDDQIQEELNQIALERQLIDDSAFIGANGVTDTYTDTYHFPTDMTATIDDDSTLKDPGEIFVEE